jgi:hypothetical protein
MNLAPIAARKSEYATETRCNWTIGPTSGLLVRRFDLAPLQGASLWVVGFPGLKPWAESSSPFGAKIPDVNFCQCPNCRALGTIG